MNLYSQCCQDKKGGEVDTDDHVQIILIKDIDQVTDEKENNTRDEHCEDVPDQRTPEDDSDFYACIWPEFGVAHPVALNHILGQISWTNVCQVPSV